MILNQGEIYPVKRKVLVGGTLAVVLLGAAYVGSSWMAGRSVQDTLEKQNQWLSSLPYFIVKNREYHRGWFSSTEKTTLQINPQLYRFFLEKEGEPLPTFEVTYTQNIQHGPLPLLSHFNPHPYKAVVTTDFQFSPETQKTLSRFFGTQKPISIENRISFNDDGLMTIKVPSFDYEEAISGVKAKWQGLNATLDYGGDFNRVKLIATAPGLSGEAKGKGQFMATDMTFESDHVRGKTGLMIGTSSAKIADFTLDMPGDNPFKLGLHNLSYDGKLAENGELIDGSAHFMLEKLVLNDQPYGPAELLAEANHLHGPTLAKLGDEFNRLQKQQLTREQLSSELMKLAKAEGMPLLTHDPRLAIRKLDIKLPDSSIHFSGEVGLQGFKPEDLDQPAVFMRKLVAKADFNVPRKVISTVVTWQARNMFGNADNGVSQADLDYLAGQFVEGQLDRMSEQKLIRVDGDTISATASLEGGKFILNGANVPLPWEQVQHAVAGAATEAEKPAKVEASK
ncbi:YdgA family protein [Silvimonas soli]|uniref:YdgA family protein n=1 Tax=Silvimonas soli TaxID=2980100 RepID=UPI0024B3A0C9|nr:YdgA family protein [Silvimonas soli]